VDEPLLQPLAHFGRGIMGVIRPQTHARPLSRQVDEVHGIGPYLIDGFVAKRIAVTLSPSKS
jgi:hypothetical protein